MQKRDALTPLCGGFLFLADQMTDLYQVGEGFDPAFQRVAPRRLREPPRRIRNILNLIASPLYDSYGRVSSLQYAR